MKSIARFPGRNKTFGEQLIDWVRKEALKRANESGDAGGFHYDIADHSVFIVCLVSPAETLYYLLDYAPDYGGSLTTSSRDVAAKALDKIFVMPKLPEDVEKLEF